MENKRQYTLLTIDELKTASAGFTVCQGGGITGFSSVATDSRDVKEGSLFVPLIGEFQNGHKYISQAIEKGASIIFVAEDEFSKNPEKYENLTKQNAVAFVIVKNTLKALQNAAQAYVEKFPNLIKVAITGSSGKTTTKELCVSVLKQKFRVVYTQGNLNSETGLPLSVFQIREDDEAGVFEMGMNHKNEIGDLSVILKAKYGIITNIGTAHIGLLGSRQNIAEEKRKVFDFIPEDGVAFIPENDDFSDFLAEGVKSKIVRTGLSSSEKISNVKNLGIEGTEFSYKGEKIHLKLPGSYNFLNALTAVALGEELGLTPEQIKTGIESVPVLDGRSQILHFSVNSVNLTVLQDCYNANPDSVEKSLSLCSSVKGRKCLVLGDMLELGAESESAHEKIGKIAAEIARDGETKLVFIGPEMKAAVKAAESEGIKNIVYSSEFKADDIERIVKEEILTLADESFVLLKGSHGIGLERIRSYLQRIQEAENEQL